MARRTTLVRLLDDLRAEAGISQNPAHNNQTRDSQVNLLQRTQERLWDDFTWPHLRVEREVAVQAGQRYYDTPEDLDISRIEKIQLFRDGAWTTLAPGIEGCHYTAYNSDLDERSWPPQRWRIREDEDVEIWPIADQNRNDATRDGTLKFVGTRNLRPLVEDGDRADLDGRLIVLFAAAELLARAKAADAQLKMDAANRIYARLRGDLMPQKRFRMFGTGETQRSRRMIAHYRPAGELMGTIWVREFTGGLDTRRMPETTPGGALIVAENGHINSGGEFEQRRAFVPTFTLPAGTVGLGYNRAGPVVFGSGPQPSGMPNGVAYQRLQHPSSVPLRRILSVDLFGGLIYVAAEFTDNSVHHFYNGALVTDWFDGRARATFQVTGGGVAGATKASGSFEITGGTNVAGTNQITNISIDGTSILTGPINHTGNNATTAAAVASAINALTSMPDYTATSNGQTVTVTADAPGPAPNGKAIVIQVAGNVTTGNFQNMAGGTNETVSRLTSLTVNGVPIMTGSVDWAVSNANTAKLIADAVTNFSSSPEYIATSLNDTVTIVATTTGTGPNGYAVTWTLQGGLTLAPSTGLTMEDGVDSSAAFQPGSFVKTIGSKMYSVSGPNMHFSGIKQPMKWTTGTVGAGFVDMSSENSGSEELQALARYQNAVAIFAETVIQIWYVDPDPTLNKQTQVLDNTGTRSPHSVTQFGDNDLFYLNESGLRSLRARDSTNAASTTDIGVPVDTLIVEQLRTMSDADRDRVFGLIEPSGGRFWLTMRNKIFVFSYFPGSKVSAWSTYVPGFNVDEAAAFNRRVWVRSGNTLYVYGGAGEEPAYDDVPARAQIPYLDANTPTKKKTLTGVDVAATGQWDLDVAMQPTDLAAFDRIATISETTFNLQNVPAQGSSTHFSVIATSRGIGPHTLGSIVLHYEGGGPDEG